MRGATVSGGTTEFRVWAPAAKHITLRMVGGGDFPMERAGEEFVLRREASPGQRYFYIVDDSKPVPDPVSRLLPEGVHGPTEIVDPEAFRWTDHGWRGISMRDSVIYELHVGTFTPQGTFDGIIARLDHLKRLGVTAIEIMPVAAFPGERNWGYDGVSPYAVQASYGGPDGLKRLVDAAHRVGLAVVLDVVYNHLGAEGNYLRLFGPYFTDKHTTPWGDAVNYDQPGSEGVRRYVIENAQYWIREYHLDGLRLDAIQTIKDDSPKHVVAEIQESAQRLARELGREVCVIAETDENDAEIVRPKNAGGWGLDGVWSDDFHHAVHAFFTGERKGYYQDFGRPEQIAKALNDGFVFQGEWFEFWKARRGTRPEGVPLEAHVICTQNHDQVGNRAVGERLSALVPRGVRKLSAALLLLAPETPLLFMGQEYDEQQPFQFFSSYGDPALQKAVREGRRNEFKDFAWDEVPDPQDAATFERSKLKLPSDLGELPREQREMLEWYRALLALRRDLIVTGERSCRVELQGEALVMQVPRERPRVIVMAGLRPGAELPPIASGWTERLASDEDSYRTRVLTGSVSTFSK